MKLLLVEDDKILSYTIKQCLDNKYQVEQAFNGYDGYMLAKEDIYDAILLDLMLPEMSGYEVLKRLRENKVYTPILILTAKDGLDDKLKGFRYGADDYLTKPFEREELLANVDGEMQTIQNVSKTLLIGTAIIIAISILASYILSKRTLKPIIQSYQKQTEFVQNASHELRTPLTIIQTKQELLLQEPNSKIIDKSEEINLTLKETRRLTKLIKELMELARADANEYTLQKEKIQIDELIKEITIPYMDYANIENKKIELNLQYQKEINIDRNKMNQLMIIILDNAIKYTPTEGKIAVKTFARDGKCQIEIADTGIGISEEAMKHVFERFYREDKARSRETGGNGLGLSIAYTIVAAHGGNIKILRNEPIGTKVVIRI